jgi:hypothetical protein
MSREEYKRPSAVGRMILISIQIVTCIVVEAWLLAALDAVIV